MLNTALLLAVLQIAPLVAAYAADGVLLRSTGSHSSSHQLSTAFATTWPDRRSNTRRRDAVYSAGILFRPVELHGAPRRIPCSNYQLVSFQTDAIAGLSRRQRNSWTAHAKGLRGTFFMPALEPIKPAFWSRRSLPASSHASPDRFDGAGAGETDPFGGADWVPRRQPPSGVGDNSDNVADEGSGQAQPPNGSYRPSVGAMSPEFSTLVQAQFEILASLLQAASCALYFRCENPVSGELEFTPVAVYPEKRRVWVVDGDGGPARGQEGPKELPGYTAASALLPEYPFISVRRLAGQLETSAALEHEDGGLSAPLVYGSVVLGLITVWRERPPAAAAAAAAVAGPNAAEMGAAADEGSGRVADDSAEAQHVWSDRNKDLLEKIASSVAIAAVLDQRQRWAATVQVDQLRRVLAETLHQVKNPLTALRTFGKLLLRRLPSEDGLNRELAKDIVIQSDRMVDLLLPVDSVIGALAAAEMPAQIGPLAIAAAYASLDDSPQFSAADAMAADAERSAYARAASGGEYRHAKFGGGSYNGDGAGDGGGGGGVGEGASDAGYQTAMARGGGGGDPSSLGVVPVVPLTMLFVQDVVSPVVHAAEALAQARRISFRSRLDDDLPGVLGEERALQEALSNVVDNALKYAKAGADAPESGAGTGRTYRAVRRGGGTGGGQSGGGNSAGDGSGGGRIASLSGSQDGFCVAEAEDDESHRQQPGGGAGGGGDGSNVHDVRRPPPPMPAVATGWVDKAWLPRPQRRPVVILRARESTINDWGARRGVVLEVMDNGPGVPEDELPFIFDRGFRGAAHRGDGPTPMPGTGLGLGIARDIMRAMGGDIRVDGPRGGGWGCRAMLFLPRA